MNEVEIGPREKLVLGVTQDSLGGWVEPREVSVEVGDGDQVRREGEDPVEVGPCLGTPCSADSEGPRQEGEDKAGSENEPGQEPARTADRFLRHINGKLLSRHHELLANGLPA